MVFFFSGVLNGFNAKVNSVNVNFRLKVYKY